MRYRHTMTLFGISLPICLILRTLQLIYTIDDTTGFIKQQYSGISIAIMIIIFAATVSVGLIGFAADGVKMQKNNINPEVALTSLLAGGMFIYDTVAALGTIATGSWYDMIALLFGVMSAAVFIAYGLKNIYDYKLPMALLVIPVLYYVIKFITVFISTSALALVTENIFLLFTNAALLYFLFEFSKIENNIDENPKPRKLFASGIIAVMLCATEAIPKIIANGADMSRRDMAAALLNIAMGVFVLSYIISNFDDKSTDKKTHTAKHLAE